VETISTRLVARILLDRLTSPKLNFDPHGLNGICFVQTYKLDAPSRKRRLHTIQLVGGMVGVRVGKKGNVSLAHGHHDGFPESSNTTFLEDSGAGFKIGFSTAQFIN
jgi:hypothetical protein